DSAWFWPRATAVPAAKSAPPGAGHARVCQAGRGAITRSGHSTRRRSAVRVAMLTRTLALAVLLAAVPVHAEPSYLPSAKNLEARRWFQDARFGLFIHWGVYSVLG